MARMPVIAAGVAMVAAVLVSGGPGYAQSSNGESGGKKVADARQTRIARLKDSLKTGDEWDIGLPPHVDGAQPSFNDAVEAGQALDSPTYIALDRDLRDVRRVLDESPNDPRALERLAELRAVLAARIEANMNLGYLYAAGVYIALLERAGGQPAVIEDYTRRLRSLR